MVIIVAIIGHIPVFSFKLFFLFITPYSYKVNKLRELNYYSITNTNASYCSLRMIIKALYQSALPHTMKAVGLNEAVNAYPGLYCAAAAGSSDCAPRLHSCAGTLPRSASAARVDNMQRGLKEGARNVFVDVKLLCGNGKKIMFIC